MANNYNEILARVNKGNQMGLSNTIKRDYGIPLDFSSVQESYAKAVEYAATSTLAYVGQPISVGDKLYIITSESQGKYPAEVEEGQTQTDVFLAEVGSATAGDNNTIQLKDGVLSLAGIDGKTSGTYVPSLVNGVLTWNVPDTSTAEGQQQAIDALEIRAEALELTVNGKPAEGGTEAVKGLVEKLADEVTARTEAIEAEQSAREKAITTVTDTIGDVTDGKTVVEMIVDAETAAKNAIPTNVSTFTNDAGYLTAHQDISGKADKADTLAGYGITDAYTKDQVDNIVSGMTHMSTEIVDAAPSVDTAKEGVIYLVADTSSEAGSYIEYILVTSADGTKSVEQIGSTKTDLSDYATTSSVDSKLESSTQSLITYADGIKVDLEGQLRSAVSELGDGILGVDNRLSEIELDVYRKSEVYNKEETNLIISDIRTTDIHELRQTKADAQETSAALATKIETAQITHTTTGVSEGVTKEGTTLKIVVDAYTKEQVYTKGETDNQIDAKIASVTGGESAADVKLSLESYRDAINEELWGAQAKDWTTSTVVDGKTVVTYTPQYGTTSRVDTLESKVGTLETNVQTAQNTAESALTAVTTLENGQVKTNKQSIEALTAAINGADADDKNGLSYRVGALEAANITHATEYTNLKAKVDNIIDVTIPAIVTRVDNLEAKVGSPATDEYEATGLFAEIDALTGVVNTKANASDVYTKKEVDDKVQAAISAIPEVDLEPYAKTADVNNALALKADASAVYTKEEADAEFMTQDEVDSRIDALIAAADPEGDGKVITNIQNLVEYVENNAGEISALITTTNTNTQEIKKNTDKLAGIDTTVTAYVTNAIAGVVQPKASTEVTVANDGTLGIGQVSTDKLVQGIDTLILDGGSATI